MADAFEVAPEVDGVILVYEVGRIGRGILKRAKVQLENVNSNVLGVILNNVKPDVAPDFYRYRTDYYYRAEDSGEESVPLSRWREFVRQPLRTFQNIIGKMRLASEAKGKRTAISLFLLVGILALAGLAWQNYPKIRSAIESHPDQKGTSAQNKAQQKPIVATTTPKQAGMGRPDVSSAAQLQKTGSIEPPPQGQILDQEEIKPDQPAASQRRGKEEIKATDQTTEEQLTRETVVVARTPVAEDRTVAEKKPAEAKALSPESSIELLVEKWRRSWEEGDLQVYIGCYHPDFRARGMNIQAWKDYKQDLFNRTPERDVKISDIKVELNGSRAVVTFKQRYQTKNYKGLGLKTFQLTNYEGNWAILEESYESLPAVVEPVEVAIQGFVENWRRAWEEGNLPTYIACYHPQFETDEMDHHGLEKI